MQTVSQTFNDYANGEVRPISWGTLISFDKEFDDDIEFFELGTSTLNGDDILATQDDNPLQAWDKYDYSDFRERLLSFSIERELDFPYSVVNSIADFTLNNYDKYFTPNSDSPISSDILPKRPVRLLQGFRNTRLSQFVGLTQGMPEISETDATATFTAMDFLTQIYDMDIRETEAMQDVRTDEVLESIFTQFGLLPEQYDLGEGRNIIKFLFFEKDQLTAGDVIRPLMQAEGGMLWLNEQGVIRFRPRLEQPDESVYIFNNESIISCDVVEKDEIINHVIINTDVREVQNFQIIYAKETVSNTLDIVQRNGTHVFKAELQDPCLSVTEPVFGDNAGVSWFTAERPDGTPVTSGITIDSVELKTNTYEMTISNTNSFDVNINRMNLWGQPAKKISVEPIIYENEDTDSLEKFEDKPLEISNNFIQDIDAARSLALTTLRNYSEYANTIELEVKGNPALQLSDIVDIDYRQFDGEYRIIGIRNSLQDGKFTQILTCRAYEITDWFTLNQSTLDSSDILAP